MKGIRFGNIHSFNDLHLILSKVNIPPATPKTLYVDLPGADGSVDLSEAFGRVKFSDRECSFVFTVLPQYDFEQVKRSVSSKLNGLKTNIVVEKDPDFYWEGRCFVNEYQSDEGLNQIVIGAIVRPYKCTNIKNFAFGNGSNVQHSIQIESDCPVILFWTFGANTTITKDGEIKNYSSGEYRMYNVDPGTLDFVSTSDEGFSVSYQGRAL